MAEELARCPQCYTINKLSYNTGTCKKCGTQYGKCAKCEAIYKSNGVSTLCPNCRKATAQKSVCMDDPLMQDAYTRMMSTDTNIFTAPGKILFGSMNVANKLSKMTELSPEEQEREALKKLEKERKEAVEEAENKERTRLQKERFATLSDEKKAELNTLAIHEKNVRDCVICGCLLGGLSFLGTLLLTHLDWWISFVLLVVLPLPFFILRNNRGCGYVSTAINWGLGVSAPMCSIVFILDIFLNVYLIFYIIWPILGIAIGIITKKNPESDIGASQVELTEEEQTMVTNAGLQAGIEFDSQC